MDPELEALVKNVLLRHDLKSKNFLAWFKSTWAKALTAKDKVKRIQLMVEAEMERHRKYLERISQLHASGKLNYSGPGFEHLKPRLEAFGITTKSFHPDWGEVRTKCMTGIEFVPDDEWDRLIRQ